MKLLKPLLSCLILAGLVWIYVYPRAERAYFNRYAKPEIKAQVLGQFETICAGAGCKSTHDEWEACFERAWSDADLWYDFDHDNLGRRRSRGGFAPWDYLTCINIKEGRAVYVPGDAQKFHLTGYIESRTDH